MWVRYVHEDPEIVKLIGYLEVPTFQDISVAQWDALTELIDARQFDAAEAFVLLLGGRFVR
jgi:hypothetical protein